MYINYKISSLIFFCFLFLSCHKPQQQTCITGDVPNLPDGVLYMYEGNPGNRIDSVKTKNGKFILNHLWNDDTIEPVVLGLDHIDGADVLRAINFPANSNFRKSKYISPFIFSDPKIIIKGLLTDFSPKYIKLNQKIKLVVSPKIKGGYQTNALFNIDGDLFDNINKSTYNKVLSKIIEYPKSYHLLFKLNDNRNSFSAVQMQNLLNLFKGEIIESKTFITLKNYNKLRFSEKKITIPRLSNEKGIKIEVLDRKFKKHLVIFWASWCGPCRQEIPALKKMHLLYKDNIEFVSISTDKEETSWQKALRKEQMLWKQLIVNKESTEYESIEIFFQLSQSIPYAALLDNNMKVIKSSVGSMSQIELENFIKN